MSQTSDRANARRSALYSAALVAGMGALSFAAVPLYDWFCRTTGFAGTTQQADAEADRVLDQTVLVRFDGNVNSGLPLKFKPLQNEMRVRIGETAVAYYQATNLSAEPLTTSATFNVTPLQVGGYFAKIECFCFEEQTLAAGETVDMPVQFFVDPELVDDQEFGDVKTITLSYTFFRLERSADATKRSGAGGEDRL
ncbi:MAG: cytochrome c oxidase assembly protein [Pseudomonadota bacterium]